MCPVNSRSSCRNSPGKALHFGEISEALRPPVPEISEITDTQSKSINIIDDSEHNDDNS